MVSLSGRRHGEEETLKRRREGWEGWRRKRGWDGEGRVEQDVKVDMRGGWASGGDGKEKDGEDKTVKEEKVEVETTQTRRWRRYGTWTRRLGSEYEKAETVEEEKDEVDEETKRLRPRWNEKTKTRREGWSGWGDEGEVETGVVKTEKSKMRGRGWWGDEKSGWKRRKSWEEKDGAETVKKEKGRREGWEGWRNEEEGERWRKSR